MTKLFLVIVALTSVLEGCASKRPTDSGLSTRVPAQAREATDSSDYLNCLYHAGYFGLSRKAGFTKCDARKPAVISQAAFGAEELALQRYYFCMMDAGSRLLGFDEAAAACSSLRPAHLGPLKPYGI